MALHASTLPVRQAARVLVEWSDKLLLLKYRHSRGQLANLEYWTCPGGKLNSGESFAAAAARELYEETGLTLGGASPLVAERRAPLLTKDKSLVIAHEQYFLSQFATEPKLSFENWTASEKESICESKWWDIADLSVTKETIWPQQLDQILAHDPRQQPLQIWSTSQTIGSKTVNVVY